MCKCLLFCQTDKLAHMFALNSSNHFRQNAAIINLWLSGSSTCWIFVCRPITVPQCLHKRINFTLDCNTILGIGKPNLAERIHGRHCRCVYEPNTGAVTRLVTSIEIQHSPTSVGRHLYKINKFRKQKEQEEKGNMTWIETEMKTQQQTAMKSAWKLQIGDDVFFLVEHNAYTKCVIMYKTPTDKPWTQITQTLSNICVKNTIEFAASLCTINK